MLFHALQSPRSLLLLLLDMLGKTQFGKRTSGVEAFGGSTASLQSLPSGLPVPSALGLRTQRPDFKCTDREPCSPGFVRKEEGMQEKVSR